ncbi:expressed unknown protein [Seminavis robusta]|uniref:Transmembrane protein n=1 Tax=Seminavis robusta TaxID=568900 RepID=A0A9N8HTP6_9STRA|nr:expressed unknown protein [Seminavis robusta]|eukprot:Sro1625_g286741.1  (204) ;mRNA; f:8193-8804
MTPKSNLSKAKAGHECLAAHRIGNTRSCAVLLGLVVGGLFEGANVGGNWLIYVAWSRTTQLALDPQGLSEHYYSILFSISAWTAASAVMVISIACLLRTMMTSTAFLGMNNSHDTARRILNEHVSSMDQFFAIGVAMGFGLWWCLADLLIVCTRGVYQSCSIIAGALVCYAIAVRESKQLLETEAEFDLDEDKEHNEETLLLL